mmetsp:Transcript_14791/g.46391  ORF Transcript_14791/g.46391 Transcript_14791/m.46391 type:complete len:299 (-) Transcript_14791:148-1044(-)
MLLAHRVGQLFVDRQGLRECHGEREDRVQRGLRADQLGEPLNACHVVQGTRDDCRRVAVPLRHEEGQRHRVVEEDASPRHDDRLRHRLKVEGFQGRQGLAVLALENQQVCHDNGCHAASLTLDAEGVSHLGEPAADRLDGPDVGAVTKQTIFGRVKRQLFHRLRQRLGRQPARRSLLLGLLGLLGLLVRLVIGLLHEHGCNRLQHVALPQARMFHTPNKNLKLPVQGKKGGKRRRSGQCSGKGFTNRSSIGNISTGQRAAPRRRGNGQRVSKRQVAIQVQKDEICLHKRRNSRGRRPG